MRIIADSFDGRPPRIIDDPFAAIPEDVIREAAANGDETAQAELDRRSKASKTVIGTLTKDRESGKTQAHGDHGHFASDGSAEARDRLERGVASFKESGGKIEVVDGNDVERIEALRSQWREDTARLKAERGPFSEWTDQQKEGNGFTHQALYSAEGGRLEVAFDGDGRIVGAASYTSPDSRSVYRIGSTEEVPGVGAALLDSVLRRAAEDEAGVGGNPTDLAAGWWRAMGADVFTSGGGHGNNNFLTFSPEVVQQLVGDVQRSSTASLIKDRESGRSQAHGEHGHFASGGDGDSGWLLPGRNLRDITETLETFKEKVDAGAKGGDMTEVRAHRETLSVMGLAESDPQAFYSVASSRGTVDMVVDRDVDHPPTEYEAQQILSTIADLHERYGEEGQLPPSIHVVSSETADSALIGTVGQTVAWQAGSAIYLIDDKVQNAGYGIDLVSPGGGLRPSWFVEATQEVRNDPDGMMRAMITHEYGHFDAIQRERLADNPTQDAMFERVRTDPRLETRWFNDEPTDPPRTPPNGQPWVNGLSEYGHRNSHEAYAEMFTEWVLRQGSPAEYGSPAAQVYGEVYKWKTP